MNRRALSSIVRLGLTVCVGAAWLATSVQAAPKPKGGHVMPSVLVVQRPWPPVVSVRIALSSGSLADPPGQEGMAQLCWSAALRGAGERDRAHFAEALESLGAHIDTLVDKLGATVVGEVLVDQLEAFLPLMADVVLHPRFEAAEVEKARTQQLGDLVHLRDEDESLAHEAIGRYLYRGQPLGRPTAGTEASLGHIQGADLRAWHKKQLATAHVHLGFAGDIDPARAQALALKYLGELPSGHPAPKWNPAHPVLGGRRLLVLDKARRSQAQIVLAQAAPPIGHKDQVALLVANTVLGGTFSSRLTHEIRELRGWSYHAWSSLAAGPGLSTLAMGFAPANADAVPSLDLAVRIVEELQREGITAAELRFAKDYLKGAHRFSLETADRELAQRLRAAQLGLPADDIDTFAARVEGVDLKTANRVLRDHLHPQHLVGVLVGSAKALQDKVLSGNAQFAVEVLPAAGQPETTRGQGRLGGTLRPVEAEQPPPPVDDDGELAGPPEDGEATDDATEPDAP